MGKSRPVAEHVLMTLQAQRLDQIMSQNYLSIHAKG